MVRKTRNINTNDVIEYMNAVADTDIHLIDHGNNKSHKRTVECKSVQMELKIRSSAVQQCTALALCCRNRFAII